VPHKNIKLLCGRPLLAYTADAALSSRLISRVILSTDDEEIAQVGRRFGVEVPFLRPPELARDETPMLPVAQHAVRFLEEQNDHFDAVCLLQPTNPLRSADDIDACIQLLENSQADAVVTTLAVPAEHNPHWVYFRDEQGLLSLSTGELAPIPRRQDLPAAVHREGSVYVTRRETLMEKNSFYGARLLGHEMRPERSVNIDTPNDWRRAEQLLSQRGLNVGPILRSEH
jgi:CMP-N-acetylneuraminic acid synthetase